MTTGGQLTSGCTGPCPRCFARQFYSPNQIGRLERTFAVVGVLQFDPNQEIASFRVDTAHNPNISLGLERTPDAASTIRVRFSA
jgi:hypothetical protein